MQEEVLESGSMLEYFAGQALAGLLAGKIGTESYDAAGRRRVAKLAWQMAEAMIEKRPAAGTEPALEPEAATAE